MGISDLIKGHKVFKEGYFSKEEDEFIKLVREGQNPGTLFITCSDSRVVPSIITKAKPGDLFVLRNVGNFVPPYNPEPKLFCAASSIEYAVSILKVEHIIICGHTHCGACEHLYDEDDGKYNEELVHIKEWLKISEDIPNEVYEELGANPNKEQKLRLSEKLSLIKQLENLFTYPGIKKRVDSEKLHIHGWYYHLESGKIEYFDQESSDFKTLE